MIFSFAATVFQHLRYFFEKLNQPGAESSYNMYVREGERLVKIEDTALVDPFTHIYLKMKGG